MRPCPPHARRFRGAALAVLALLAGHLEPATAARALTTMNVAFHVEDSCTVTAVNRDPSVDCTNRIMPIVEQREQRTNGSRVMLTVVTW